MTVQDARAAELAALDAELAGQGGLGAPGAGIAAPAPVDDTKEAKEFIDFVVDSLAAAWPWLNQIYDQDAKARLTAAAAPVMKKYDFNLDRLFASWGAEVRLAAVALPLGARTWVGIKEYRAHLAAEAAKPKADQAPAAGAAAPAP